MKTIFCGPPHSGKTVLMANLLRLMPSDSYLRINANGDGEGTWSNNSDQNEVMSVRDKTGNTPEEFRRWEKMILDAKQQIVLIDIGGKIQDDKIPLFQAADSFVILSSDPNAIMLWKSFGEENGCRCLAIIQSFLNGEDEVFSTDPILKARISGLERGVYKQGSATLKALAELIIKESGYHKTELIDFSQIGDELGCASTWHTKDGIPITHVHLETSKAPNIYSLLRQRYNPYSNYRIYNLRTNWAAAIAAESLANGDVSRLSLYDDWTDSFVTPSILTKSPSPDKDIYSDIKETDDGVYLSMKSVNTSLDIRRFREYTIPVINENKPLYLSGRFPIWFTVSVIGSYRSPVVYVLQPGNHYICVKSPDNESLGHTYSLNLSK